jgi:hypothetical protein
VVLDFMPSSALRGSPVNALEYGVGGPEKRDLAGQCPDKIPSGGRPGTPGNASPANPSRASSKNGQYGYSSDGRAEENL